LALWHYKLTLLDVIKPFFAERFLRRFLKLPTVQSIHIYAGVEILYDVLEKLVLAFFSVLNVGSAFNSQVYQGQSILSAFFIYLHI
jgi:hypothetical protein